MYIYENDGHILVSIMGNSYDLVMRLLFSVMVLLHFLKQTISRHVACIYENTFNLASNTRRDQVSHVTNTII